MGFGRLLPLLLPRPSPLLRSRSYHRLLLPAVLPPHPSPPAPGLLLPPPVYPPDVETLTREAILAHLAAVACLGAHLGSHPAPDPSFVGSFATGMVDPHCHLPTVATDTKFLETLSTPHTLVWFHDGFSSHPTDDLTQSLEHPTDDDLSHSSHHTDDDLFPQHTTIPDDDLFPHHPTIPDHSSTSSSTDPLILMKRIMRMIRLMEDPLMFFEEKMESKVRVVKNDNFGLSDLIFVVFDFMLRRENTYGLFTSRDKEMTEMKELGEAKEISNTLGRQLFMGLIPLKIEIRMGRWDGIIAFKVNRRLGFRTQAIVEVDNKVVGSIGSMFNVWRPRYKIMVGPGKIWHLKGSRTDYEIYQDSLKVAIVHKSSGLLVSCLLGDEYYDIDFCDPICDQLGMKMLILSTVLLIDLDFFSSILGRKSRFIIKSGLFIKLLLLIYLVMKAFTII